MIFKLKFKWNLKIYTEFVKLNSKMSDEVVYAEVLAHFLQHAT